MLFSIINLKVKKAYLWISLFCVSVYGCQQVPKEQVVVEPVQELKAKYMADLDQCIAFADSLKMAESLEDAGVFYKEARKQFKHIEPVLSYIEAENYGTLNQPNLLKVEEEDLTDIKIFDPEGFQVLEELIFMEQAPMEVIRNRAKFVSLRLQLIRKNTSMDDLKPYHVLWLIRDAITRVSLMGITGYDSPALQQSLEEAQYVYESIDNYLAIYAQQFSDLSLLKAWSDEMEQTIALLASSDFESFDRYTFIKEHSHKQLALWNQTVKDWEVEFPFTLALQNDAPNYFSKSTFNMVHFAGRSAAPMDSGTVKLGKQLFHDTNLSANGKMSCATCHQPEKAFTDGLTIAKGINGKELQRNVPTLYYAAYQKGMFYDKRSGNLEGQIVEVTENPDEFHSSLKGMVTTVSQTSEYQKQFGALFKDSVSDQNIRKSIAAYIRTLAPFNSKFDRNIRGEEQSLTEQEIHGFNLFMGKAACGTCHFAPLFNGTLPTRYKDSELEALGVPETKANAKVDDDLGRYYFYKTDERKHFFKTSTVRNAALTAPYMHNGVYDDLNEVMDFYNNGGGAGMGLDVPLQTLPPDSLQLNETEIEAIIAFMETLTDAEKAILQDQEYLSVN